jgi:long-chain acyl-CoA synthetase
VSVLPCWHIFERTGEYWMYSKGIHTVYSNVKNFKNDLAKVRTAPQQQSADSTRLAYYRCAPRGLMRYSLLPVQYKPQFIFAVPRLFETIYRGVLNKFASEKPGKRKIIDFFTKVSMAHVQALRTFRGLVIRDAPPSPVEKVRTSAAA